MGGDLAVIQMGSQVQQLQEGSKRNALGETSVLPNSGEQRLRGPPLEISLNEHNLPFAIMQSKV